MHTFQVSYGSRYLTYPTAQSYVYADSWADAYNKAWAMCPSREVVQHVVMLDATGKSIY